MTASARRRTSLGRTLVALGAVALLGLLAVAALFVRGAFADDGAASGSAHDATLVGASGGHEHDGAPTVSAIHQQPSTHARSVAFAVLVSIAVGAACLHRRLRLARVARAHTLRVAGLPPGRAPPALRIA
jgi:hypothetical protein